MVAFEQIDRYDLRDPYPTPKMCTSPSIKRRWCFEVALPWKATDRLVAMLVEQVVDVQALIHIVGLPRYARTACHMLCRVGTRRMRQPRSSRNPNSLEA